MVDHLVRVAGSNEEEAALDLPELCHLEDIASLVPAGPDGSRWAPGDRDRRLYEHPLVVPQLPQT